MVRLMGPIGVRVSRSEDWIQSEQHSRGDSLLFLARLPIGPVDSIFAVTSCSERRNDIPSRL